MSQMTSDAIIKKLSKKTKMGEYDPVEVVEALNVVEPGWTIEPTTTTMQASGYSNQKDRFEKLWADALGLDTSSRAHMDFFTEVPADVEPFHIHSDSIRIGFKEGNKLTSSQAEALVKEILAKIEKPLIKSKTLPSNIRVDGLYFAGFKIEDAYRGASVTLVKPRLGVPGFLIKSPAGLELELPVQPTGRAGPGDPTKLAAAMIWTWLYKETDAPAKAAAYLETPETQGRHSVIQRAKDIELAGGAGKVGTCAICLRFQKLERKKTHGGLPVMVHHGYRRPGIGYIFGDCLGVSYPPYELSAVACADYVEMVVAKITRQKIAVQNVKGRTEMKTWLGFAPRYRSHMLKEYRLVTISKDGTIQDHGQSMDNDKMTRMKKSPTAMMRMSQEEIEAHREEFKGQEGRLTSPILAEDGTTPASIFANKQKDDLDEAQGRLASMENDKNTMEKRIKDWTLQPLPGTASASSARIDAVAEKLHNLSASTDEITAAVEEAAYLLAQL